MQEAGALSDGLGLTALMGGKDSKFTVHSLNENLMSTCRVSGFHYSQDRTGNSEKTLWPHDMYVPCGDHSGAKSHLTHTGSRGAVLSIS